MCVWHIVRPRMDLRCLVNGTYILAAVNNYTKVTHCQLFNTASRSRDVCACDGKMMNNIEISKTHTEYAYCRKYVETSAQNK